MKVTASAAYSISKKNLFIQIDYVALMQTSKEWWSDLKVIIKFTGSY